MQDAHDSSFPENTEMKIEDANDITMNLSSASIQGSDSPDNMEGSGKNEQMVSGYSVVERYYAYKCHPKIESIRTTFNANEIAIY